MDGAPDLNAALPSIVRKLLDRILNQGERQRMRVADKHGFVKAYHPFTVAATGRTYALVFMASGERIQWALTTRLFGRVNLMPGDDAYFELRVIMRLIDAIREDDLFETLPDTLELRA